LINTHRPDVIAGTETWLTPDVMNSEIIPPELEYNIYRKDRPDGYGGVMLAVSNKISSVDLPFLNTDCEIIWAKLCITGSPVHVAAYYRPHISDEHSLIQLDLSLHKLQECSNNPIILLTGDFNLPGIEWSENIIKHSSPFKALHEFSLEILQDHGLQQLVTFPTRESNTLDLVSTNRPSSVLNIHSSTGISDHDIICFEVATKVQSTKQIPRSIYMYNKANWNALKEELTTLLVSDYNEISESTNVDQLWSKFRYSIAHVVDKYIPHKLTKTRRGLPWINQNIKKLIRKRDRLYKLCKNSFSEVKYAEFKSLKHLVQKEMRSAYWSYTNNLIAPEGQPHSNQKRFWSYIKALRRENTNIPVLNYNGSSHESSLERAEVLNQQFQSVFTKEPDSPLPDKGLSPHPTICDIDVSVEGVHNLLLNINPHKACGPDQIHGRVLKETADVIAPFLQTLFQSSLHSGVIPDDWRSANITPIFKQGDRQQPSETKGVRITEGLLYMYIYSYQLLG